MNSIKLLYITLIAAFLVIGLGCEKNELPPSFSEEPVIFLKGDFDGIPIEFSIEDSTLFGSQYIVEDTVMRYYVFDINDALVYGQTNISMIFYNHISPIGDYSKDLDSTLKVGSKSYASFIPPPWNPLQTGRVSIDYQDGQGNVFSSLIVLSQPGFFSIDSVYSKDWVDGKTYKIVEASFECKLYNTLVADSVFISNGQAVMAFEEE